MENLKEYIVTAKSYEVLDDLCNDIESPGGALYIPNRAVDVANLRPISRNTHYYLTDEEAELLRKDPRVIAVEQPPSALGIDPVPVYTQDESWRKSFSQDVNDKNWGLLRCFEGVQRNLWGDNGIPSVSGPINVKNDGTGVDVVIVDGHIDPTHPEYAVNSDGTGGSRVVQYNWYALNPTVTGGAAGTYTYTPYFTSADSKLTANNCHGSHVAGTAAGNSQGWARGANIYNIYPYSNSTSYSNAPDIAVIFDYIRVFHRNKPVDPVTGKKRPTIANNSWGYFPEIPPSQITSINYRGTSYGGPFTTEQLASTYGFYINSLGNVVICYRDSAIEADIQDAIAEGIIVLGAAGNNSTKCDIPGGVDYNNTFTRYGIFTYYYHRGSTPGADNNVICVGAVGTNYQDYKGTFSNCGPRVDIYAPGQYIMSSVNTTTSYGGLSDPRNSSYSIVKMSGTSMACPQVTGVLACALEVYPGMKQSDAMSYIKYYSKLGQLTDTGGGYTDRRSLQGSENRYLAYNEERKDTGNVYPKNNYKPRPASGVAFPRTRVTRYGR